MDGLEIKQEAKKEFFQTLMVTLNLGA